MRVIICDAGHFPARREKFGLIFLCLAKCKGEDATMKFTYRKVVIALIAAIAFGWLLVGTGVVSSVVRAAKEIITVNPVVTFTLDGLYDQEFDAGISELTKNSHELKMELSTTKLPTGVYTYWWLVDEDGKDEDFPFDFVAWATYDIVGEDGLSSKTITLEKGKRGIEGNPTVFLDERSPGIRNLKNAVVEVELVLHGSEEAWNTAGMPESWITTFWEGEAGVCDVILFPPTPNGFTCPLAQLTLHAP
jgi:hypothetical protein